DTILKLLKQINNDFNITIVLITHEMRVIEEICDRVLVLDEGKIAELGGVKETFESPKTVALKRLLLNRQSDALVSEVS
ncbi:MAG: methionine ABC transporter ATP-binding protein, partial [Lachnospiraceae bacterium]|nr:methionine ABC transporter ATP-binding protein [Lachnospiraceae bacterium]